jgi:hypothetical protein
MPKYLRRTTSAAAGDGLGTTAKYLVNQYVGAENNWAKAHCKKAGHESARILLSLLGYSGFCSKLRAPHGGTFLGSCGCWARAGSLCSFSSSIRDVSDCHRALARAGQCRTFNGTFNGCPFEEFERHAF